MATFKDSHCVQRMGNESHLSRLSSGLNQLRQQSIFCDVNIIVGDKRFPAHKAVLISSSDYFQRMFSSGFQESTMSEVTVPGTEESFAQILDFVYTGYFTLSLQTVIGILRMACYMIFNEAMELCNKYLRYVTDPNQLIIEDCFEIWSIASNHDSLSDVAQLYRSHLMRKFAMLVKSRVFLENSSASVMMDFLIDEEIETDTMTEEHILEAALIWVKFDWEQRKVHAVDRLKQVRFGLVPLDRLQEILGEELLAIPECKDMVAAVVKLSVTKETASPPLGESHPELFATRNTITAVNLYVAKYDALSMIALECTTDIACYKLTRVPDFPNRLPFKENIELVYEGYEVCVTDMGHLYAAGSYLPRYFDDDSGESEKHCKWTAENNFFRYDPEKNEWILLPPMPIALFYPLLKPLGDYLYAFCSESDRCESSNTMLRYCTLRKTWTVEADDLHLSPTQVFAFRGNLLIKGTVRAQGPNLPNRFGLADIGYSISQVGCTNLTKEAGPMFSLMVF